MRDLKSAYNNIMKDVEKYYSEEEKVKRAKEKITKGVGLKSKRIRYGLKTQKNVELRCECSPDKVSCKFNLTVPIIRFTSVDYVPLSKDVSFEKLCELISKHKKLCKDNIIETSGNLNIGFYQVSDLGVYVTGLVKDKIVFIFRVHPQLCTYADLGSFKCNDFEVYIDLDKEVIILCFRDRELMIRLEDYSIVG